MLTCPSDPRGATFTNQGGYALTWYVGIGGNNSLKDGILQVTDPATKIELILDGSSNTIMIAERPPSYDKVWGWWDGDYEYDRNTPVKNASLRYGTNINGGACPNPAVFKAQKVEDPCAYNSVYSMHSGGMNVALGDGSVRFLTYSAANLIGSSTQSFIEAYATRAGNEAVNVID